MPWQPFWIPICRFKIYIWNCPHWICWPHKCMFRHQNAVYIRFISWDIHKYWFCVSISDILQHQRVPSQTPNLNIFPQFSQLGLLICDRWNAHLSENTKFAFVWLFFLSLPKITLSSLDESRYITMISIATILESTQIKIICQSHKKTTACACIMHKIQ